MEKRQFKVFGSQKTFFFLIIIIIVIVMMTACSRESINHTNPVNDKTSESAVTASTSPNEDNWMTLVEPVSLKDILDFNMEDIQSLTIIKYQNNMKTGTVSVSDKKRISEVAATLFDLSVIHTKEKSPGNNIVYEIYFNQTTSSQKFLSITSMTSEKDFAVGGSFVDYNNLNPLQLLIQTNSQISFNDIQIMLETLLTDDLN